MCTKTRLVVSAAPPCMSRAVCSAAPRFGMLFARCVYEGLAGMWFAQCVCEDLVGMRFARNVCTRTGSERLANGCGVLFCFVLFRCCCCFGSHANEAPSPFFFVDWLTLLDVATHKCCKASCKQCAPPQRQPGQGRLCFIAAIHTTWYARRVVFQCDHSQYPWYGKSAAKPSMGQFARFLYQTRCSCVLLLAHRVLVCLCVCLLLSSEDLPQSFPCRMRVCGKSSSVPFGLGGLLLM